MQSFLDRIQDSSLHKQAASAYAPRLLLALAAGRGDARIGSRLLKMAADTLVYTRNPNYEVSQKALDRLFRIHANKILSNGSTTIPTPLAKDGPAPFFGAPRVPAEAVKKVKSFDDLKDQIAALAEAHKQRNREILVAVGSRDAANNKLNGHGAGAAGMFEPETLLGTAQNSLKAANELNAKLRPDYKLPKIKLEPLG